MRLADKKQTQLALEPLENRILLSTMSDKWTVITPLPLGLDGVAASVDEDSSITILYDRSNRITYTESDGDIFRITFRLRGTVAFTTNNVDDQGNINGNSLGIDINTLRAGGSLKIVDTNPGTGDGIANIDWINVTGAGFGSIDYQGAAGVLNAQGNINTINVRGSLNEANVDGNIRNIRFFNDIDNLNLQSQSISRISAMGDLNNAIINTSQGGINNIDVRGDMLGMNIDSAGEIRTLRVRGNLDGDLAVDRRLNRVNVGGDITGNSWTITDSQDKGLLNSLSAKGNIDITTLDVQGSINRIISGTRRNEGNIAGNYSATGTIGRVTANGDLLASFYSGQMFRSLAVNNGNAEFAQLYVDGNPIDNDIIRIR